MFSWDCKDFLKQQKQPPEVFRKKGEENTCVGVSLVSLQSTLIKKTLQHRYFPVNITKFLRRSISEF